MADPEDPAGGETPFTPEGTPMWSGSRPASDLPGGIDRGQILGDRYRIEGVLGKGGMGEVWRARDLKLGIEVALKAHRVDTVGDRGRELLRAEVLAARQVVSPNVCRVFDLVTVAGRELVAMEYIDGTTLLDVLRERGPLEVGEARELASQFLAGLEAIHDAGLVHRDFKPENVMITRAGRVVVMDFGIARATTDAGQVSGTPAYMAPEQWRGEAVDARADVFAAGVVLAEMVSPEGVADEASRENVWQGVREEPPRLPRGPWERIVRRAVDPDPGVRFSSAAQLSRALEEVTVRVAGGDDSHPFPGLASFTEADADFFFGREAEVEAVWKRLQRRPRLLGVIGPSGAGKSSFLRAGVAPAAPEGWAVAWCTPGDRPWQQLLTALAEGGGAEVEDGSLEDPDRLVEAAAGWRRRHAQAVLVIDQFEELFTLNPPEVQHRFSELLERLVLEADVHVILSMRDDFLFHCSEQPSLASVFSDLLPLRAPAGAALRRAVVQPALACGYRFDDEGLVESMLAAVVDERGALPLLAFAASRLWERRDRERGLLTREAYEKIGGVGGALARHAEETLERIGKARIAVVRELFRNLVTAEGTRAGIEAEELLSVLEDPATGRAVLDRLLEARLLTSTERSRGEEKAPERLVEITHEALLGAWPRLVHWRTQDAEGAQLRDQLRQASRLWEERDRPEELLWTGTSFRELLLWRERYPGGITTTEEAFVTAAEELAGRRQRRRRRWVAAGFAALVAVLTVVAGLWRSSEQARRTAVRERDRATASELVAFGQLAIGDDPSAALAYARKAVETSDDATGRRLALEAVARGPAARVLDHRRTFGLAFSPDGAWLARSGPEGLLELWPRDGGPPRRLEGHRGNVALAGFAHHSRILVTYSWREDETARVWSVPRGETLRTVDLSGFLHHDAWVETDAAGEARLVTFTYAPGAEAAEVKSWPLTGEGPPTLLRHQTVEESQAATSAWTEDADGTYRVVGNEVHRFRGWGADAGDMGAVVRQDEPIRHLGVVADGSRLFSLDAGGTLRIWTLGDGPPALWRSRLVGPEVTTFRLDPAATRLAFLSPDGTTRVFDLQGPPAAAPLVLRGGVRGSHTRVGFSPDGRWLATAGEEGGGAIWDLHGPLPAAFAGHDQPPTGVAFSPDGRWLYSSSSDRTIRRWGLSPESPGSEVVVREGVSRFWWGLAVDPTGRLLLAPLGFGHLGVLPLDGGEPRALIGFEQNLRAYAFDPEGHRVAAGGGRDLASDAVVRIWELSQDDLSPPPPRFPLPYLQQQADQVLDAGDGAGILSLLFTSEDELITAGAAGLRRWDLAAGTFETLRSEPMLAVAASRGGGLLACILGRPGAGESTLAVYDLASDTLRPLPTHGARVSSAALSPDGSMVVSGDAAGVVRAGPADGGEPHLLLGHEGSVGSVAVSPDGAWIASEAEDLEVRRWAMPTGAPLHTLRREELVRRLEALTNLEAVEDPESSTGYRIEVGEFPGWQAEMHDQSDPE